MEVEVYVDGGLSEIHGSGLDETGAGPRTPVSETRAPIARVLREWVSALGVTPERRKGMTRYPSFTPPERCHRSRFRSPVYPDLGRQDSPRVEE